MEELKESIEMLEKKIDSNADSIMQNMNKLHSQEKKINTNASKIEQNSYALEILKDYKTMSKRLITVLIIVLFMWFLTIGYLVYVLNDTGTIETTQEVSDVNTIDGSIVNNGDNYGES